MISQHSLKIVGMYLDGGFSFEKMWKNGRFTGRLYCRIGEIPQSLPKAISLIHLIQCKTVV